MRLDMRRDPVSDRVADEVYDTVRSAIDAGWDIKRFRQAAADSWEEILRQDLANVQKDFAA